MGDWYVFHFRLAPGYTHEDALDVLSRVEGHPAVGAWGFGDADAPGDERAADGTYGDSSSVMRLTGAERKAVEDMRSSR